MNILFIIIILFIFFLLNLKKEYFDNMNINAFCSWDHNDNKCKCVFQKDDVRTNFPLDDTKCNNQCINRNINNCNEPISVDYWCPLAGKCIKYFGKIADNTISSNNCGYDILNNQLIMPYATEEDCLHNLDYCNRYNDPNKSITERKSSCLNDMNCGLCTNKDGESKCISGNASGPNDLNKYFYCKPNYTSNNNKYEYGDHATYILQK